MAINFPDNPFNGQTTTFSGVTYSYNSTKNQWTANNPSTANISSSDNAPTSPSAGDLWFNSANGVMYIYYNDGSSAQWISISGYASSFDSASTISLIDSDYVQARQTTAASTTIVTDINGLIAISSPSNGDQAYVQSNNNLYFYDSGWYKIATVSNDSPTAITGVLGSYVLDISGGTTTITAVSTDPEGLPLTWSYSTTGLGSIATISQADNVFTITPSTNTANAGSFTLTINVTDGINGALSTSSTLTLQFAVTNSKYTAALITAVDTSDNNNITDASSNNHSITVAGDVIAGTFSPYRHGGYSVEFDGNDGLSTSNASNAIGTSDFTVEAWVYINDLSADRTIATSRSGSLANSLYWLLWVGANGSVIFRTRNNTIYDASHPSGTVVVGRWYHIVGVRESNVNKVYVNGVVGGTTVNDGGVNLTEATIGVGFFNYPSYETYMNGYIKDFRLVKSAVYTSNFTPPTEPLTAVSGTELLTCQSYYFIDNSTNNHAITVNGNTSIKAFSSYDHQEYSASDHGGSVYFDGSGDYLEPTTSAIGAFGNNDFTIEFWIWPNSIGTDQVLIDCRPLNTNGNYPDIVLFPTGQIGTYINLVTRLSGGPIIANTWTHVAVIGTSSGTTLYINGSQADTDNYTASYLSSASRPRIGVSGYHTGTQYAFSGYLSDIKIVEGTALYTSDFTPPASPTSSSGANLHIKGTDASIIDKSQSKYLKLFGNATGSTTQVKFASTKSMYFDGNGDSLSITPGYDDPIYNFGTADWTIEVWAYIQTLSSGRNLISFLRASTNEAVPHFYTMDTGLRYYVNNADVITTPSVLSLNTWHHIALTRNGNDHKIFVDGTHVGSTWTNSITYVQGRPVLGDYHSSLNNLTGATNTLHGYAQDLRITKGLARYTSNFTPPTSELQG